MANVQRMGLPPQGTAAGARPVGTAGLPGQQQTIVLARPPAGVAMTPGVRPQFTTASPQAMRAGSIIPGMRVQAPAGGVARPIHVPTVAGGGNLVINNPGLAPGQPGSQITVPIQSLQSLQPGQGIPTGQAGHLLVKTENNQYQILRVDTSAASSQPASLPTSISMSSLRPSVAPALPTRPVGPASSTTAISAAAGKSVTSTSAVASRPTASATAAASGGGMGGQMTPDTAKLKCKNFLSTLLRLAGEQPAQVAMNVRNLIQGLIDGKVEPEVFTTKLQRELSSSPQPCLVPFLKKSLPYLQQSLAMGELTIEGVVAPAKFQNRTANLPGLSGVRGGVLRPSSSNVIYPSSTTVVRTPNSPATARGAISAQRAPSLSVTQFQNKSLMGGKMTGTTATKIPASSSPLIQKPGMRPQQILTKPMHPSTTIQKIGGAGMALKTMPMVGTPGTSITPLGKAALPNNLQPYNAGGVTNKRPYNNVGPGGGAYSTAGDDDINDVAAMGGVNLAEETQRMASGDLIANQVVRSCKDETFLQTGLLHERISRICRNQGLEEPPSEVINLVSHATQERLKTLLEKLAVVAEHRLDVVRASDEGDKYDVSQDVRGQIKFMSELEKIERKRHDEAERELLFRAAKSRTKTEDPEKEKLRAKAKELQRFEEEQQKHEKANTTAMLAIGGGPRKKFKTDDYSFGAATLANRPRIKRVHVRDLLFLMEQEKETKRSPLLWKSLCS